jgi:hypothetical protein
MEKYSLDIYKKFIKENKKVKIKGKNETPKPKYFL